MIRFARRGRKAAPLTGGGYASHSRRPDKYARETRAAEDKTYVEKPLPSNILALSGRGDRPPSAGTGRRAQASPSQASCRTWDEKVELIVAHLRIQGRREAA